MAKRPEGMERGNDILFKKRGNADEFDHYEGPMGGDMRMSIKSHGAMTRDRIEGFQVQKVSGYHGPKPPKSRRNDDEPL